MCVGCQARENMRLAVKRGKICIGCQAWENVRRCQGREYVRRPPSAGKHAFAVTNGKTR